MDNLTVSLTMWGKMLNEYSWNDWYYDNKKIFSELGLNITHLGVISPRYNSGKVLTVLRKEKEILENLKKGEIPTSFSCYALPHGYRCASFDYELLVVRNEELISIIMLKKYFSEKKIELFIKIIKKYINMERGQIYEMDRNEVPLLYATGLNSPEFYKSLNIYQDL